ncbi:hypothetical protein K8I61_03615 [bacterium]|nr:hypothetical protein [bacterium]
MTELSPFQPGCPDSFVSDDGTEICVITSSGVRYLEGDVVVDSHGSVHIVASYGRDLRVYSLAADIIATGQVRPTDWTWERVAFMSAWPRMTIDEHDVFHIAYTDTWNREVRYATGAPGDAWTIEVVDAMAIIGPYVDIGYRNTQNAIALRPDGIPHMAWRNGDEDSVRYGHRVAGTWETEIVFDANDIGIDVGYETALDVAPDGSVHLVSEVGYSVPWAFPGLIYASKTGDAGFIFESIGVFSGFFQPEIAAESAGHAYVSYQGVGFLTTFAPRIAEKDAGTWSYFLIGPPLGYTYYNSVGFDAQGVATAFFSWGDGVNTFRRARQEGAAWVVDPVYSPDGEGWVTRAKYCANSYVTASLVSDERASMNWVHTDGIKSVSSRIFDGNVDDEAFDLGPDDSLHLLYSRAWNFRAGLRYVTNVGGQWRQEFIADLEIVSHDAYPDIAVDSTNRPHIIFWDQTNLLPYYAKRIGVDDWSIEITSYYSVKLDLLSDDTPVALQPDGSGMLQIGRRIGDAWTAEPIFPGVTSGADMVIGPDNDIHIVYRRDTSFYYATDRDGGWTEQHILDVGNNDGYATIALDSQGYAHSAIYDASGPKRSIYYANNVDGSWSSDYLEPLIGKSSYGYIALDANDVVYIYTGTFYNTIQQNCAIRVVSDDLTAWSVEPLDCAASGFGAIAIDTLGRHVATGRTHGLIFYRVQPPVRKYDDRRGAIHEKAPGI